MTLTEQAGIAVDREMNGAPISGMERRLMIAGYLIGFHEGVEETKELTLETLRGFRSTRDRGTTP